MKIRIYSDIHQELHREDKLFDIPLLDDDKNTVLILAGDIDYLKFGLELANRHSEQFKAVIYVPGNHEYYNDSKGKLGEEKRWPKKYS